MPYLLLRISAMFLLTVFFATDLTAQKRSKKRSVHPRNAAQHTTAPSQKDAHVIDIRDPEPTTVPIPQENTLTPKHKKTKKVIIAPAPPPPPGRDHVPSYPKR